MRKLRLGRIFGRKGGERIGVDIGRIGEDDVVAPAPERREQIAVMERHSVGEAMLVDVAARHRQRFRRQIDRVDRRMGKDARGEDRQRPAAGAKVERALDGAGSSMGAPRPTSP